MSRLPVLSRRIDAAHVPASGLDVAVVADERQRNALAKAYGLIAVNALSANATLTLGRGGSIAVDGRVTADIMQSCVVSLVPVAQRIDEPFSTRFVTPDSPELVAVKAGAEAVVDPAAPDPPETMDGNSVDVGALVEEVFALAIDPYPRAPGAELPAEARETPKTGESPFAVLAKMRPGKAGSG